MLNRPSFFRIAGIVPGVLIFIAVIGSSTGAAWAQATPTPTPEKQSLVDASNAAKKRGKQSLESANQSLVISNKTLMNNADKGHITTASTGAQQPTPTVIDDRDQSKMEMWRQRYLESQRLIETIEDEIQKLNTEIPDLWHQFYSIDDAHQRDRVLRPLLDSALSKKRDFEKQLEKKNEDARNLMRDARIDGALPGWFRNLN